LQARPAAMLATNLLHIRPGPCWTRSASIWRMGRRSGPSAHRPIGPNGHRPGLDHKKNHLSSKRPSGFSSQLPHARLTVAGNGIAWLVAQEGLAQQQHLFNYLPLRRAITGRRDIPSRHAGRSLFSDCCATKRCRTITKPVQLCTVHLLTQHASAGRAQWVESPESVEVTWRQVLGGQQPAASTPAGGGRAQGQLSARLHPPLQLPPRRQEQQLRRLLQHLGGQAVAAAAGGPLAVGKHHVSLDA
jgi:hypothetical protein